MLDVCLAGCGGTVPKIERFLSSCYMRYNGVGLLIDCGEGTQIAVKKAGFSLGKISTILLTHFHADHCSGLPGLLLSMGNEGHTEPLLICGPKGVDEVVKNLTYICPELPFRVNTQVMGDFDTFERDGFSVTSFEVRHSCPCIAYDVRINRAGRFDVEKAKQNGVPVALWSRLQKGEEIDGYTRDMVLGETRRGIHVTYSTDTRPTDMISTMATDADLLICEGMFESEKLDRARESSHMTVTEAANLARESGCRELWLTHFSPALPDPSVCIGEATAIFPNTTAGYDGLTKTIRFDD